MTAGDEAEKKKYTPGPGAVDITPDKDGGVLKEIIKEGEGDARPGAGCTVTAHYTGTLVDGTVFDSSMNTNKPLEFTLGRGSMVEAWEIGIPTMRRGEVAMFTCKPEYAYKEKGSPPKIPPNATLIFKIELVNWIPEDISQNKDMGILRTVIEKGKGYVNPQKTALVEIHMTGIYNDKVFEDRDVSFNLGEGSEFGVIEGVEMALLSFKKEEKSRLEIQPKYAFEQGHKEFGIPPNAVVTYIVELKNFETLKYTWDMDAEEKIAQAKLLKEKATNYFKAGKYALAAELYKSSMNYVESDSGFSGEGENDERKSLLLSITLNLGLAYLKMNQNYEAKKQCDSALEMDPNNVKALFRRGQAYLGINEPENAKLDFEAVVRLEPNNKLAANQILVCCNKMKQQREREKKIYANMFEKFAQKDKEEVSARFGWWDDEKKKPIITTLEPEFEEEEEDPKTQKKRQLEHLKKMAEGLRKEVEDRKLCLETDHEAQTTTEGGSKGVPTGMILRHRCCRAFQLSVPLCPFCHCTLHSPTRGFVGVNHLQNGCSWRLPRIPEVQVKDIPPVCYAPLLHRSHNALGLRGSDYNYFAMGSPTPTLNCKEESVQKEPDTMKLGEWGKDERDREPTEFEQENPDILILNKNDEFKNM